MSRISRLEIESLSKLESHAPCPIVMLVEQVDTMLVSGVLSWQFLGCADIQAHGWYSSLLRHTTVLLPDSTLIPLDGCINSPTMCHTRKDQYVSLWQWLWRASSELAFPSVTQLSFGTSLDAG